MGKIKRLKPKEKVIKKANLIKDYSKPSKNSKKELSIKVGYMKLEGLIKRDKDVHNAFIDLLSDHRKAIEEELLLNGKDLKSIL